MWQRVSGSRKKKRWLFLPWDKAHLGIAEAVGFFRGQGRQLLRSLQWSAAMFLERRRAGSSQIQPPLTSFCSLTWPPGLISHLCLPKSLFCLLKWLLLWLVQAEFSRVRPFLTPNKVRNPPESPWCLCNTSAAQVKWILSLSAIPKGISVFISLYFESSCVFLSYYLSFDNLGIFSPFLPSLIMFGTQNLFLSIIFPSVSLYPDFGLLKRSTGNIPFTQQADLS